MLKPRFLNGLLNTFFLICFKSLPSTLTFAKKQLFLTFLTSGKSRSSKMTPRYYKQVNLIKVIFFANINVDGKLSKQIKEIDIQQCLPIETGFGWWLACLQAVTGGFIAENPFRSVIDRHLGFLRRALSTRPRPGRANSRWRPHYELRAG